MTYIVLITAKCINISVSQAEIRKELNDFKRFEMEVHPESEYMTRLV